jgi:hypothetical protein
MDNINQPEPIEPKNKYWKFILGFLGIILGVFILYVIGFWAVYYYRYWQSEKTGQKAAEFIKQAEQADYQRAMADTYGGKTPQETLQMYIDAVEKGDYELASKYFIGDYQEKELRSFEGVSKKNINNIIQLLNEAMLSLDIEGGYDIEKEYFSSYKPTLIRMKVYPNGIWKIIEIFFGDYKKYSL